MQAHREIERPILGFIFRNERGQNLFGDSTYLTFKDKPLNLKSGERVTANFEFRFPYLPRGDFWLSPSIVEGTQSDHRQLDWLEDAVKLTVVESSVRGGKVGLRQYDIRPIGPARSAGHAS